MQVWRYDTAGQRQDASERFDLFECLLGMLVYVLSYFRNCNGCHQDAHRAIGGEAHESTETQRPKVELVAVEYFGIEKHIICRRVVIHLLLPQRFRKALNYAPPTWFIRFSSFANVSRMSSKLAGSVRYMSRIAS